MGARTNKQLHAKLRKRKGKNVPKSTISDHTTKLAKLRLLTSQRIYNLKQFYLTDHGKVAISEIMTKGQGLSLDLPVRGLDLPVRGHGISFVCEILRRPRDLDVRLKRENWVAFYPKNRVAYKSRGRIMGCMVIFNPRSVQFVAPAIYGPSQDAAFEDALRLVEKVKRFLEDVEFPGLVLGDPSQVYRVTQQHYARPFDPLANEYYKNSVKTGVRTTYRSDRLAIDMSLGLPELETVHRVFAKDDLRKITEFYESYLRGDVSWSDLEAIKFQLPEHMGQVMERLDALDKGHVMQDKVLSQLAGAVIMLTADLEKFMEIRKPPPRRRARRKKVLKVHRKPDKKVEEVRRKVEETLAKLEEIDTG